MSYKIRRLLRKSNFREDGFTLIEVLIGIAILSLIAVGIFSALSVGLTSTVDEDERGTAKNLAEAQMEYVKQLPNNPQLEYEPDQGILSKYNGYRVTIDADPSDRGAYLQLITVTVFQGEERVWRLEGYKLIPNVTLT